MGGGVRDRWSGEVNGVCRCLSVLARLNDRKKLGSCEGKGGCRLVGDLSRDYSDRSYIALILLNQERTGSVHVHNDVSVAAVDSWRLSTSIPKHHYGAILQGQTYLVDLFLPEIP